MKRQAAIAAAGLAAAFALAACGERPQVIEYQQGHYQGKADTPPWVSATYNGDQAKWESDIKARNQMQSEYVREN